MNKSTVLARLRAHSTTFPLEEEFRQEMIRFVETHDDFGSRHNFAGHLTASAWITDPDRKQVLLLHHAKLDRWLQPGGHLEEDSSLLEASLREAREETGLKSIHPLSNDIFDLDIHLIPARKSDPAHHHLDVRFLLEADPDEVLQISEESLNLRWFGHAEFSAKFSERSLLRMFEKL